MATPERDAYLDRMEVIVAEVLLKAEPDKKPEGSQERRDWLSAVLWAQGTFIEEGRGDLFKRAILEE